MNFWNWAVANGAGLSATAAAITAIIAVVTLIRASNDSRARTRPIVMAAFESEPHADRDAYALVVRNVGPTSARDLSVSFEPALVAAPVLYGSNAPETYLRYIVERFLKPIPVLAPGQVIRPLWACFVASSEGRQNEIKTPDDVIVTIRYRGSSRKMYEDVYPLLALTITRNVSIISSESIRGAVNRIAKAAEQIHQPIK